ncbi:MAG: hypothetical protein MR966_11605 [Lachnospiraceae bacterium]|nr:hypothetical protein [Lachnospiraceae bacterium]MDY4968637.1 hypothetical protein [Lachnospiraceae bacterium]
MEKTYRGYCPTQKQENYPIQITYIGGPDLSGNRNYEKGTYNCQYDPYGDKCAESTCPIFASAPEKIH